MKKTLAENYRRLFKGRVSSNDNLLLTEQRLDGQDRMDFADLLFKTYVKLNNGTELDANDYKSMEKYKNAIQSESDEVRNGYLSFVKTHNKPIPTQKKALELFIKTMFPKIIFDKTVRNFSKKLKAPKKPSMSSSKMREMIEVVQSIYQNAKAGDDQTDDIIDELGDFYNAVYRSNDDALIEAYDTLRGTADGSTEEQMEAAANLLTVLGVN